MPDDCTYCALRGAHALNTLVLDAGTGNYYCFEEGNAQRIKWVTRARGQREDWPCPDCIRADKEIEANYRRFVVRPRSEAMPAEDEMPATGETIERDCEKRVDFAKIAEESLASVKQGGGWGEAFARGLREYKRTFHPAGCDCPSCECLRRCATELEVPPTEDITLRDFFAGCALMGLMASNTDPILSNQDEAYIAWHAADAMLKARGVKVASYSEKETPPSEESGNA